MSTLTVALDLPRDLLGALDVLQAGLEARLRELITTDTWQLVEQAQCGLCVEPENPHALAEAIRTLYAEPALRERLASNGREHVVQHDTQQMVARQYHELLTSLVGQT